MLKKGVLSNDASQVVIRIVPLLIITKEEIDHIIDALVESIKVVEKKTVI